jgi:hypothetical protein
LNSTVRARNGRIWLEAGIAEKVAYVHEIHEQYGRREARRNAGSSSPHRVIVFDTLNQRHVSQT